MFWLTIPISTVVIVVVGAAPKVTHLLHENMQHGTKRLCANVCQDLPKLDLEPVCMMFSRYKKGFQFFVNMCHARRAVCKESVLLHVVHPNRCKKSKQFFLPVV
ncbi:uncharacterized protein LOC111358533 [Spodoptera litura]|uniref:Uncharacterized protein LOC111358533 n=1 Tax=Spodoptera litura TaxID=69820 RepID=A0A9J7IYC6_SPOLT|nr:uncharacterized protein LOC111358533 [Spodoptera litura]